MVLLVSPVAVDGFPGISKLANPKGVEDALLFEIELIASDGSGLEIEAMFDTGFSAWLAVNDQDIDGFGWIYVDQEKMRTAQGTSSFDI